MVISREVPPPVAGGNGVLVMLWENEFSDTHTEEWVIFVCMGKGPILL